MLELKLLLIQLLFQPTMLKLFSEITLRRNFWTYPSNPHFGAGGKTLH